ncbi:MAG: FAD-dependent oxidoreductase [Candidatus Cloacimonetes bacterium]|nr:FAD-dependent oxidoreductase [Candidatus Cloacimonadota bacterium]
MIEVILNGKKVETEAGITILELAKREGIKIPTLCHDEELKPYGSCWVCAVEVAGRRGFVTSCGTVISSGMEINTDSEAIRKARKMALELLISDHYADCVAPCTVACPDHVDIQTYVSLIANGQYHEAVKVIKDTLPLPLSIGRVCPAFCEKECRRQIVEDPIAIRQLKRFAADEDLNDVWNYVPEKLPAKGKKIAIIGAGPSGLTCGYYLSNLGYEVQLYESAPAAGGWLRYGIPEYRLPKAILDAEIALLCSNGMQIEYNVELGRDLFLQDLARSNDAVYLAIGAQKAVPMPVPGSDLQGCLLGVDFLKAHALGCAPELGKKVAIVGGGNTAIDCARTALRKGCEVSLIYRRTKEEMPAEPFEIEASEHEGITFYYLSNPVEYIGLDGHLHKVKIEKMRLGEADSSGRRRPEPTGEFFELPFDSIIAAISQVPEIQLFADAPNQIEGKILPLSRWQTAIVDEATMFSGIANVFAGGDFRRGAATAIEAIADGRLASVAIDKYLQTGTISAELARFDSKKAKSIQEVSAAEYSIFEQAKRLAMPELPVAEAATSFKEVELGYTEEAAIAEADRCLECGCQVNETCSLREYCTDYQVNAANFIGGINKHPIDYTHPFIVRDANKCINCGRCIRTCTEIQGAAVLGFIYRGFSAIVGPEFGESLTETTCLSCGKCIDVCPVGALIERSSHYKQNPCAKDISLQNCGSCGLGCQIQSETQAGIVVNVTTPQENPGFNGKNLCFKGRFGWQAYYGKDWLGLPRVKTAAGFTEITWNEAAALIANKLKECNTKRFEISPHICVEEMLMLKKAAENSGAGLYADSQFVSFSDAYLELQAQDNPYDVLDKYSEYIVVGELNQTLATLLRLKQREGKKLILINYPDGAYKHFADACYSRLGEVNPTAESLFIYNQNRISEALAYEVWCMASTAGQHNILHSTDFRNHLGMLAMQPKMGTCAPADFVLCYGDYPQKAAEAKFSIAIMSFMDDNAPVDLVLPQPGYLEIDGLCIADMGHITKSSNPANSPTINELLRLFYTLGWIHPNTADLPYWNAAAQEFVAAISQNTARKFDPKQINPENLLQEPCLKPTQLEQRIALLFEQRKDKTGF